MTKREYLTLLMQQRPDWIRASMAAPTRYMTRTHVLLHAVALRRMQRGGAQCPKNSAEGAHQ